MDSSYIERGRAERMISPDFNFREFLRSLEGMSRDEIIQAASRERRASTEFRPKRGSNYKYLSQKQDEYTSDLGDFLYFVRNSSNSGMSWPDAYLASPEHKNKQRARNLEF